MIDATVARVRPGPVMVRVAVALGLLVPALSACGAVETPDEPSALDAYLDEIYFTLDAEEAAARHAREQEMIAACMAEAGFDYQSQAAPHQYRLPEVITPEYAAEFGYGETTETSGPDVPPSTFSHLPGTDPAFDENNRYVESLSVGARDQYFLAMHGADFYLDEPPEGGAEAQPGCRGRAIDAVYADGRTPDELEHVATAIREEIWWVTEDPRVTAANPAWVDCMADAGYPGLEAVEDAVGLVVDRINASSFSYVAPWDELKQRHADELVDLRRFEVEVAVADTACREQVGWYDVREDVLAEGEATILELYRAELDAWLQWVREQRAEQED